MSILIAGTAAASAPPPSRQVRLYGCTMRFWNFGCKQQCNWYKIHTFTPVLTFFVRFFSRFCKTLADDLSDPPRSGAVVSLLRTIFNNNSSMHVYIRHTHIITYIFIYIYIIIHKYYSTYIILIYIWA